MYTINRPSSRALKLFERKPEPHRTSEQWKARRRVAELKRIYQDRFPNGLPHNRLGVKFARYICRTMAFDPVDQRAEWLDRHARWLEPDARYKLLSAGPYWYAATSLAQHLELYDEERERLQVRTIPALDVDDQQRKEINLEKERQATQRRRRQCGVKPREQYEAESLSRTEPWKSDGISRRTWYRRKAKVGTSLSVSTLSTNTGVRLVPTTGESATISPATPSQRQRKAVSGGEWATSHADGSRGIPGRPYLVVGNQTHLPPVDIEPSTTLRKAA